MTQNIRNIPTFLADLVDKADSQSHRPKQLPKFDTKSRPYLSSLSNSKVHNPQFLERIKNSTPSQIGIGRTGTRYTTDRYLKLRADHAIAKDAVSAELAENMASQLGCIPVTSQCKNREHYLLNPNEGRRLSEKSREVLSSTAEHGMDVTIILADGLAATATNLNGPILLPSLLEKIRRQGIKVGKPILAKMARVGLQDDIGTLLESKATMICLGERPGLGTGDSLSIYIAIGPKIEQDNAEKNCISNVRPQGLSPEEASLIAVAILERGLKTGRGGLNLS